MGQAESQPIPLQRKPSDTAVTVLSLAVLLRIARTSDQDQDWPSKSLDYRLLCSYYVVTFDCKLSQGLSPKLTFQREG